VLFVGLIGGLTSGIMEDSPIKSGKIKLPLINGSVAPHGLPDLILASSQFLVRISHENKRTMAAACGSLA